MFGFKIISLWLAFFCWGLHQMVPHAHHEGSEQQVVMYETLEVNQLSDVFSRFQHVQPLDHLQDDAQDISPAALPVLPIMASRCYHGFLNVPQEFTPRFIHKEKTFLQERLSLPPPVKG